MSRAAVVLCACLLSTACSKKSTPPAPPTVTSATTPANGVSTEKLGAAPSTLTDAFPAPTDATVAIVDDAVEAEIVLTGDLELGEGKTLPSPKFTACDKEATKAHVDAVQKAFDAQLKDHFLEISRFNASFVPATYLTFELPGHQGARLTEDSPTVDVMVSVEGTEVTTTRLASHGSPNSSEDSGCAVPYELWNTPRGYFLDLGFGFGTPVYILRRDCPIKSLGLAFNDANAAPGMTSQCIGKLWKAPGSVDEVSVPTFPTRGRDVDGDGNPEFPGPIFSRRFQGWTFSTVPRDTSCNLENGDLVTLDVVGIENQTTIRTFEEHRLAAARARANRIRVWAGESKLAFPVGDSGVADAGLEEPKARSRKHGELRMTNGCALDVAQAAAELFVHARVLGADADTAIADADALMHGFALRFGECAGGIRSDGKADPKVDHWAEMRADLLAWTPQVVAEPKPAAAAAGSASTAPSGSASAK